ncbi:response regulator transcription factor [bacterium]|nr:response regulator transcription factor [bacterium]
MNIKHKVIIVDDHPIVREGLINLVRQDENFIIVGFSGDGAKVIPLIETTQPDIIILDISLPNVNGLEIVRQMKKEKLGGEVVILTMFKEEAYFDEAMNLGVKGYLLKENALAELIDCLHKVADGRHYICPELSDFLIDRHEKTESFNLNNSKLKNLSDSEKKVLELISQNLTSKEIADQLTISLRTVQNHRSNICHKLGFHGYHRLLQFALENKQYL